MNYQAQKPQRNGEVFKVTIFMLMAMIITTVKQH